MIAEASTVGITVAMGVDDAMVVTDVVDEYQKRLRLSRNVYIEKGRSIRSWQRALVDPDHGHGEPYSGCIKTIFR